MLFHSAVRVLCGVGQFSSHRFLDTAETGQRIKKYKNVTEVFSTNKYFPPLPVYFPVLYQNKAKNDLNSFWNLFFRTMKRVKCCSMLDILGTTILTRMYYDIE